MRASFIFVHIGVRAFYSLALWIHLTCVRGGGGRVPMPRLPMLYFRSLSPHKAICLPDLDRKDSCFLLIYSPVTISVLSLGTHVSLLRYHFPLLQSWESWGSLFSSPTALHRGTKALMWISAFSSCDLAVQMCVDSREPGFNLGS